LLIEVPNTTALRAAAENNGINFFYNGNQVGISLDETTTQRDVLNILHVFASTRNSDTATANFDADGVLHNIPSTLTRTSEFLTHPVFSAHHSESEMMRYIKSLENKDLSLNTSMISLGSCTMKLNAATQLIPVSWPAFNQIHPFAPADQWKGYQKIVTELEQWLTNITGFAATSLQPNSGAQGEYAGLLTIRAYHADRNDQHRNIILIPISAHGTNPASAVMAGFKVVVTKCDEAGNIDINDLSANVVKYKDQLAGLMVTYPSTHGVFEESIKEICEMIHDNGGLVYMDGANMNAQVGLTNPATIGADVCHLNLHKTFAIPHGGGGPGVGPICVNEKLVPFLPTNPIIPTGGSQAITAISSAPFGSALVCLISYGYITMLGAEGLKNAKALREHREAKRKFHTYVLNRGDFEDAYAGQQAIYKAIFEHQGLSGKKLEEALEKSMEQWINESTRVVIKQSFYERKAKLIKRLQEVSASIEAEIQKDKFIGQVINSTVVYNDLIYNEIYYF
jgi:glycine dehydrogenase